MTDEFTIHEWMHTPTPYIIGAVVIIALVLCAYMERRDR